MSEDQYTERERVFGAEVKRLREDRGWTLSEMATALRDQGVDYASAMTVSRTEKLQRPVRMSESIAYGKVFGRSVYELTEPDAYAGFLDRALRAVSDYRTRQEEHAALVQALRADADDMRHWLTMIRAAYTEEHLSKLSAYAQERWDHAVTQLEATLYEIEDLPELAEEEPHEQHPSAPER